MGEFFMDNGADALIIYDDLTKQAGPIVRSRCYCADRRARAYPGDVFICTRDCWSVPRA